MHHAVPIFLTLLVFLSRFFPDATAAEPQVTTLSGTTTTGLYASTSEQVLIDGNMKLGQFSLAFDDLSIDLPGTPLAVTRTYDSHDQKGGDFGPGWSLATSSVKVRKVRSLASDWEQTNAGNGFNLSYAVTPTRRKRVIVTFPGGRTEAFEVGIRAATPLSSTQLNVQNFVTISGANYTFSPVGATSGKLEVVGNTDLYWSPTGSTALGAGEWIDPGFGSAAEPTRFRYTEPGGASYVIDENSGLLSIRDANSNTVTINQNGIYHSAGEAVLFTRNAAGRITEIKDATGKKLTYSYDAKGRLVTVYDRIGNFTQYAYSIVAFPHYLTDLYDAKGTRAIRTAYDAEGRMISQTDANGKTIGFTHQVSERRESITDRLGNITTHEFDEYGNVTRTTDVLGGVTTRSYDANDNETSTTTPLGFTTARAFDAKNNLLQETDPLGNVSRYTYDAEKRPLTIADALDQSTRIAYDTTGNLTSMTDPAGTPTTFSYGGNGNISSLSDANGTTTSYTHDSKGREKTTKVTTSDGTVISSEAYDYDASGNRIRSISSDGTRYFTTNYAYDAEGRLTRTDYPNGTFSATNYNANGKAAYERNTAGYYTYYTYDTRGNLIKTDHPGTNRITRSGYDADGRMTSSTDMAGATTYILYDALGRATATIQPDASMPASVLTEVADIAAAPALADNPRTLTSYDADGRVTATTDALGNSTTFEYDDAGRRAAVINALGNRMTYAYDAAGRQTSSTDAKGNVTTFTYDAGGRLTRTDLPDGNFTLSGYDTLGRRITSTDAEGNVTRFAYDGAGRLIAVTDALGGITRYGYDQRGLQTAQTDALGRTTTYEYDLLGRRTARILPQGQREEMTYNNLGQLVTHKDFNGQTITRTYEPSTQNLLSIVAPAAHPSLTLGHAPARYDFTYDVLGRRTTATVKNKLGSVLSSETYGYDIRSQLTGYTGPNGSIGYGYDVAGNLAGAKSSTAGGYDVSYDYDSQNRITMVHRGQQGTDPNATELAAYNYDANGNLNGVGYANGVQHAYTYNALNRLTDLAIRSRDLTVPSSSYIPLQGYSYQLNKNGHRTQISELSGRTISHTFDALHRLTAESITTSSLITDHCSLGTLSYSYDSVGNRQSRTTTGSATLTSLLPNQTQSFTSNDRLTSDTYDANGNTTSSQGGANSDSPSSPVTDVYSFDNKLIRRSTPDGKTIDLTYNPDGHRLAKLIAQGGLTQRLHHYLTDANNPTGYAQAIEEKNPQASAGQELKKVHLYGHDLVSSLITDHSALITSSQHFYSYDGLGSVRGITDETGELLETYAYDAYGTIIGLANRNPTSGDLESSPITNNSSPITKSEFLFTGEQWDADLGMYFLRARYLNTNTGRFHTQDTYEGRNGEPLTLHKYLYAHGNPAKYVDPSGYFSMSEATTGIGNLTKLVNFGFRVVNIYDNVKGVLDIIVGVRAILGSIGGEISLSNWKTFVPDYGRVDLSDAGTAFLSMATEALGIGSANWIAGYVSRKKKISSYLIYLPTFFPIPATRITTGVKLGGVPVKLVAGANGKDKLGSLIGLGVGIGNDNYQLMRMDIGKLNPGHGGQSGLKSKELRILHSEDYHMHVYQWGYEN